MGENHATRLIRLILPAFVALGILTLGIGIGSPAQAQTGDRVRPFWGSEALWGFWEFGEDYISRNGLKVTASATGTPVLADAADAIDGDSETFVTLTGHDVYELKIDLGKSQELGALTLLTLARPNKAIDSRMARYEIYVSDANNNAGPAVAQGVFDAAEGSETVVRFPAAKGRFVTLKAFARATPNKEVCIREIRLVSPDVVKRHDAAQASAAAGRRAAWESRDSDQALDGLGKEFLDLIFCTSDDINRSNLRTRSKLEEVGKLKKAGKFAEGLRGFRDYYFDKLRHPQRFGLNANDVSPYGRGYGGISDFPQAAMDKDLSADGIKKQIALADDLLKGNAILGGKPVAIGQPGAVDWNAPAQPYGYTTKTRQNGPYRELWWSTAFQPLFTAYIVTKDEKYLKRWIAYMDDWAMSRTFLSEIHPAINHDNSEYPVVQTLRMFAAIAEELPYDSDAVPAGAFARIMRKLVMESPLNRIVYMRSNGNGWTPGAGEMLMAMMIDEFKVAPIYFRETRRRNIEDINVTQQLRDGTETHQWPGYNFLLLRNAGALRLIDARDQMPDYAQPVWERELHTIAWRSELTRALNLRASYTLHWGTPSGEYPLVTHQEPPHEKRFKLREAFVEVPSMLDDPTNAKLYSTFYGDGAAGKPQYTSEWFPYGGYSIARDGWSHGDGYGSMFCSPKPGCGGVGSGCKNNAFALSAYGMDLIGDDLVHAYVRPTSPIQVDGKRQQLDFYIPKTPWPTAHRGDMITEWTEPSPWRWHSSAHFDLMEGVFNGVYANDFKKRDDFVAGVAHQRVALHARSAGLWILTDRMKTEDKHDYEQLWWLPLKNPKRKEYPGFSADTIAIDSAAHTIKTRRTTTDKRFDWDTAHDISVSNVNLSMYQFTDAPITYATKAPRPGGEEMYDWMRVGATWQGQGNQQIVTVLFPRKPTPEKANPDGTENDLASIKPLEAEKGVNGFEAVTPSGERVTYLAAANSNAKLAADGIEITGESLLISRSAREGDEITGIALGCSRMKTNSTAVAVAQADFEFSLPASLDATKLRTTPIYRPITPVKIFPQSDVFADSEEVTLECKTPGTFITYTTDGTEPTPQSQRYTDPFKIERTITINARAYRDGVEKNPPQTSGTHATPTSYAIFTKQLPSRAESVKPKASGLNCDYYEGYWKDLWLSLDKTKPLKSGIVPDLFDLSIIPDENAPVGPKLAPRQHTYALKYTGYLNVPADGVYTIHAPHEFVHCDQVAGYELQVYLGHAFRPDNNGMKRDSELNFWYPATRLHGFGSWSVPLQKGPHELKIIYIDFRTDSARYLNRLEGVPDTVWTGEKPDLRISGPGIDHQPIPASWLWH